MVAVIEQSITPLAAKLGQQKYVIAIRDGFTAALPFMIIGSFMLVFIFPPFSADTTNSFARGWLDFSQTYREQLMLPFNLSMGVMTFFISVGIGASLGRQFNLDPVMSGLLAFMAFLLVAAPYADGKISTQYLSGHFYRADHRHLRHPRLRVAEAEQRHHSPAERSADRRGAFV
jgi:PTS system cellobiose-specific IIC component